MIIMVQFAEDYTTENELLENQQQRCVTSNSERQAHCVTSVKGVALVGGKIYNQG